MYEGDSFFTLGMAARIGLLALSLVLMLGAMGLVFWLSKGRKWPIRCVIAVLGFVGFVWASPQVYYAYYRMIFDGLPQQWVIGGPPALVELWQVISFTGRGRLSDHGQGALFWTLLGVALLAKAKGARDPQP